MDSPKADQLQSTASGTTTQLEDDVNENRGRREIEGTLRHDPGALASWRAWLDRLEQQGIGNVAEDDPAVAAAQNELARIDWNLRRALRQAAKDLKAAAAKLRCLEGGDLEIPLPGGKVDTMGNWLAGWIDCAREDLQELGRDLLGELRDALPDDPLGALVAAQIRPGGDGKKASGA